MIRPVELFIGLRYLRAKRRTRFVSFITLISLAGVALGVAALIVILSVMNGFEGELRTRLLSMAAHGQVSGANGRTDDWRTMLKVVSEHPGVAAAAPLVQMEGMIQAGHELRAVYAYGVEPALEAELANPPLNLLQGSLDSLQAGSRNVILGRLLAINLGLQLGDSVVMLIPRPLGDGTLQPLLERFVVSGIFEAGLQEQDAAFALVNADDAAKILGLGAERSAVRFRAHDVMAAPAIAAELRAELGADAVSSDWTVENASYFRAIRIEKMMMSLILSLIIAVAAFNIVASLVMVVTDKTNDIAVLRTLGMRPAGVVRVFFIQGAVIGWIGVFIGVALGVVLALNVPVIVPFLEQTLGFQIMPGDVFYVTQIPSELVPANVISIAVAAFLLTSLATLYPARRAAHVNPATALRYE